MKKNTGRDNRQPPARSRRKPRFRVLEPTLLDVASLSEEEKQTMLGQIYAGIDKLSKNIGQDLSAVERRVMNGAAADKRAIQAHVTTEVGKTNTALSALNKKVEVKIRNEKLTAEKKVLLKQVKHYEKELASRDDIIAGRETDIAALQALILRQIVDNSTLGVVASSVGDDVKEFERLEKACQQERQLLPAAVMVTAKSDADAVTAAKVDVRAVIAPPVAGMSEDEPFVPFVDKKAVLAPLLSSQEVAYKKWARKTKMALSTAQHAVSKLKVVCDVTENQSLN